MWRTSWLSREVIVLPAFIGVVALWWLRRCGRARRRCGRGCCRWPRIARRRAALVLHGDDLRVPALHRGVGASADARQLRAGRPVLGPRAVAARWRVSPARARSLRAVGPAALRRDHRSPAATRVAGACAATRALRHRSTLQSATGIAAPRLVQTSMGMSAGSFNTREFFHRASHAALSAACKLAFARLRLRAACCAAAGGARRRGVAALALARSRCCCRSPGLLADRWFFFAQAQHPQNLYYQVVS